MIQHIVMYWAKEGVTEAQLQETVEKFYSMQGKIPGLISVQAGQDFLHSERSCDFCLCTTLESPQALKAYQSHPAHLPVKAHVHTVVARSASADFEVPEA